VVKVKFYQGFWSVACNTRKLAEKDLLDLKLVNLKCHLCHSQKDVSKLGKVLDVHSRTLTLSVALTFLIGDNLDYLRPY
jgi:hypothetical protein